YCQRGRLSVRQNRLRYLPSAGKRGNIIPNIVNNLDLIAHLHSAGHPGRHELQFGESDYKVIFSAVDKAGYTGCCGLEYGPLLSPEESLIKAKEIYG
ncbi:MAG: hypothetical protein J6B51_06780, partial [Clostridia bacterium]|nr:hypothetical protein [Clostridia bacterium]